MDQFKEYMDSLRKLNELQRTIVGKRSGKAGLKKQIFSEEPILGKENFDSMKEMIYRFKKMDGIYSNIIEYLDKKEGGKRDKSYSEASAFRYLYNWLSFQAEMIAYLILIVSYHNEELVRSVAPRSDIVKYKKEIRNFTNKQKKLVKNLTTHHPLDSEYVRLNAWMKRAVDDSKKEQVL